MSKKNNCYLISLPYLIMAMHATACYSEVKIVTGDNKDPLHECCLTSSFFYNKNGCFASKPGSINSWSTYAWGFFEGSNLDKKDDRLKEQAGQAKGWSPDIGGFRVNKDGTVSVRFVMSQEDINTFKQSFTSNASVRVPFAFEIDVVDDKTKHFRSRRPNAKNSIFGTLEKRDYKVSIQPHIQGEDLDSKFVIADEGAYDEKKTLSALISRPDLLEPGIIYEVTFSPNKNTKKGKSTEVHFTFQVSVNYKYISAITNGVSEKCDFIRFVGEASDKKDSDQARWGFNIPINRDDVPEDNSLPEGAINGWYYYGVSLPDAWDSKTVKIGKEKSSTYCFDDTVVESHDAFGKEYCNGLFSKDKKPGDPYIVGSPVTEGTADRSGSDNSDISDVGDVSIDPQTGSWTDSPQKLSVTSDGAEVIHYTMVNTYDGSDPPDPAEPSPSVKNDSIKGPSGTFELYADSGQYKRSKIRFVGCNSGGCGSASSVFSYTIDRREGTGNNGDKGGSGGDTSSSDTRPADPPPNGGGGNGGKADETKAPDGMDVSPTSGDWMDSPHEISVNSGGADRIYCTLRTTLDGSIPEEPPEPTVESHDSCDMGVDHISGSSGNFKFWGAVGQKKFIKVRFRGYRNSVYGTSSSSYIYSIDMRAVVPTRSIKVTNPEPGEEWESDRSHHIRWDTDNIGGDKHVMIRYSPDDGSTWYTIAESTSNDGSKEWDMEHDKNLCSHMDTDKARIKVISIEYPEIFTVSERFNIDYKRGNPDC